MAEWRVTYRTGASLTMYVEAENEEEALDAAYDAMPGEICAQCSGWGRKYSLDLGEWELEEDAEYFEAVERVEN